MLAASTALGSYIEVRQARVLMHNRASQSAVPAQPIGAIWIEQVGSGPLVLKGPAH